MKLDREQESVLIKHEREYAMRNFKYFRKRVCNYRDFQDFHDGLDRVLFSPSRYKLIKIPRNHLKSSDMMAYVLFSLVEDPDLSVLYESSVYAQAKKYISEMKGHMQSDRWKSLFGDWEGTPWSDSQITVSRRTKLQPAPTISASGLDKSQTGQHYDLIILDDLVDELNSKTTEGRLKAINRYKQALSLLRPDGRIILIGTPWDRNDLYGWIEKDPAISSMFEMFCMDVYDKSGRIRFHQKFCEKIQEEVDNPGKRSLEALRIQLGAYQFSCQYRVNPEAEEFSEFKRTWFRWSPVEAVEDRLKNNRGKVCIFCDPAMGKDATVNPCDTAIIVCHFMPYHRMDVIDHEVGCFTPGDTVHRLHYLASKYAVNGDVEVFIEDVGFQGTLITLLERERSEGGGPYFQVFPAPPKGDKDRRIRGLFPYYQNGQITHSEKIRGLELEDQLYRFPKDRKKDAVDAFSQFVYYVSFPLKQVPPEAQVLMETSRMVYSQRAPKQGVKKNKYSDESYLGTQGEMFNIG